MVAQVAATWIYTGTCCANGEGVCRRSGHADVFDYIECFYNPTRRHSTWGCLSLIGFEREAGV